MKFDLPPAWRRALPGFAIVLIAVLLLFGRTGLAMVEIWERSGTFAHAFVVPPIALWLIWRQRAQLALMTPRVSPWFLLPMALMATAWLLGDLVAVNSLTQFAFTAMLVLCVPLLLGWQVARALAFPLCFLFFCVPLGEFMLPQMMEWTADFTVLAVRLSGVPVYREGLQFIIPSGSWSVVQACSGIRYLIASGMVGVLFAYLNYRSLKRRLIFTGVSLLLPLLANWLRAYMIVMLGHLSGNKIATGVDHLVYGWVFFGIVMLLLFMIGMRWAEPDAEPEPPAIASSQPAGRGFVAVALAALLVLAAPVAFVWKLQQADARANAAMALNAPDLSGTGWSAMPPQGWDYKPHFVNPRTELQADYARAGGPAVGLYLAYYRGQDYGSKLVSSDNLLVPVEDHDWRLAQESSRDLSVAGRTLNWRAARIRTADLYQIANGRQLVAWQIYWVGGHWTRSDTWAKLYALQSRLLGAGDDSAVLVLYADAAQDGDSLLKRFAVENFVLLDAWLSGVRQAAAGAAQGK